MREKIISKTVMLCLVIVISSCDDKRIYDSYQSTSNSWHKDSIVQFKFVPPDTVSAYNLFVNLRNTHEYPFNNLYLITTLTFPNGKTLKDTLEYKMAAPSGELLGTGFSDIKENKLWYKGHEQEFVFDEDGEYTLAIRHAMRSNGAVNGVIRLEGVTDVGFRIERRN